ncbi:MAG: hypothetical protein ACYC6Y_18590, partial [Thermoguttaceae bacterium]
MLLEVLLVLLILLAVVTVIGHFIWVVLAWIVRAIAGTGPAGGEGVQLPCPWCEQATVIQHGRCQWCGRTLFDKQGRAVAELAAVRRRLQQWQSQGKVAPEEARLLLLQLESERRVLLGLSPLAMTTVASAGPSVTAKPASVPAPDEPVDAVVVEPPRPVSAASPPSAAAPAILPSAPVPLRPGVSPAAARSASQPVQPGPARQTQAPVTAQPAASLAEANVAPGRVPPAAPRPVAPPRPPQPPVRPRAETQRPPHKSWRQLIQSFLEEREIPAVELFGVLLSSPLIITGAVILVIYFWETLQEYPVLKFAAFSAATVCTMLLGLLACIRWQLKTTGRGLLGISLLLVPLSFVAVARSGGEWTVVAAELATVALFSWLITWAGRVVVPDRPWHLAASILAPVAAIVVVSAAPDIVSQFWRLGLFGTATVAAFAAVLVLHRRVVAGRDEVGLPTLIGAFFLLGTSLFPLVFALGLAAKIAADRWIGSIGLSANALSGALSLAAAAILGFAVTLTGKLEGRERFASWRAAATAVGLTSVLGMLAGMALAWPWPGLVLLVALLDTVVLAWIAVVCRFRWLHAGAIATGAVVCTAGYHLATGHLPWILPVDAAMVVRVFFGGATAGALFAFSGLLAAVAAWCARIRRPGDALVYAGGTVAVAAISAVGSAAAAWWEGGASVPLAMVVFGIYGTACFVGNFWLRRPVVSSTGLALLVVGTLWGLYWAVPTPAPVWAAVLGFESLGLAIAGWALGRLPQGQAGQPPSRLASQTLAAGDLGRAPASERSAGKPGLLDLYRGPALDGADALAGLTLVVVGLIIVPHLSLHVRTVWPGLALLSAAGAWLVGAWVRDSFERTWAASATVLLMLVHTFVWCLPGWLQQPWLDAVLLHATLGIAATLACQPVLRAGSPGLGQRLQRVMVLPVSQSAGLSSAMALPLLLI